MLQIAIHRDDVFPACVVETSGQSRGLAKVAAEFDNGNAAAFPAVMNSEPVRAWSRGPPILQNE